MGTALRSQRSIVAFAIALGPTCQTRSRRKNPWALAVSAVQLQDPAHPVSFVLPIAGASNPRPASASHLSSPRHLSFCCIFGGEVERLEAIRCLPSMSVRMSMLETSAMVAWGSRGWMDIVFESGQMSRQSIVAQRGSVSRGVRRTSSSYNQRLESWRYDYNFWIFRSASWPGRRRNSCCPSSSSWRQRFGLRS
jgi:hypothetical protein